MPKGGDLFAPEAREQEAALERLRSKVTSPGSGVKVIGIAHAGGTVTATIEAAGAEQTITGSHLLAQSDMLPVSRTTGVQTQKLLSGKSTLLSTLAGVTPALQHGGQVAGEEAQAVERCESFDLALALGQVIRQFRHRIGGGRVRVTQRRQVPEIGGRRGGAGYAVSKTVNCAGQKCCARVCAAGGMSRAQLASCSASAICTISG